MHIEDYSLDNMCEVLDISKRTYYKYRAAEDKDYYDYLLIKEIFDESKGTYGYRRICEGLLIKYGVIFNHKKVQRIMNKYHLMPKYHKKLNKTKYIRIESNVMPNLLKRNFKVTRPNQKWTTDITYLIYKEKRLYLSTILDLYDKKVVAYQISKFNHNTTCFISLLLSSKIKSNFFKSNLLTSLSLLALILSKPILGSISNNNVKSGINVSMANLLIS